VQNVQYLVNVMYIKEAREHNQQGAYNLVNIWLGRYCKRMYAEGQTGRRFMTELEEQFLALSFIDN